MPYYHSTFMERRCHCEIGEAALREVWSLSIYADTLTITALPQLCDILSSSLNTLTSQRKDPQLGARSHHLFTRTLDFRLSTVRLCSCAESSSLTMATLWNVVNKLLKGRSAREEVVRVFHSEKKGLDNDQSLSSSPTKTVWRSCQLFAIQPNPSAESDEVELCKQCKH